MNKDEAIALAAKRNAAKSKHLAHKAWVAVCNGDDWAVELQDSAAVLIDKANVANDVARRAVMNSLLGNGSSVDVRSLVRKSLLAKAEATVAAYEQANPDDPMVIKSRTLRRKDS